MELTKGKMLEIAERKEKCIKCDTEKNICIACDNFVCANKVWREEIAFYEHVRELMQANAEGRLVVLPCKVGAPVYTTHWWKDVKEKCTDSKGKPFYRTAHKKIIKKERFGPFGPHYEWLGKTVFLTREEAEASLEKIGGVDK